jgi:hypothetical protein
MAPFVSFTADQFETWIPAREVYRRANDAFGSHAAYTIVERLRTGLLLARARHAFDEPDGTKRGPEFLISKELWKKFHSDNQYLSQNTLWNTGATEIHTYQSRSLTFKFFDVRFDPDGVGEMLPPKPAAKGLAGTLAGALRPPSPNASPVVTEAISAPVPKAPVAVTGIGGRPRKEFWDDLLIAVFEKFWLENFSPKSQADVERAMLDWVSERGERLGESSVKAPARKLWKLFQKGEGSKT